MYRFNSSQEQRDFLEEHDLIHYKIVGGLGNQLFGLSAAYQLFQTFGKRVAIDISNLDHSPDEGPEWSNWARLNKWCELVTNSNEVQHEPAWNLIKPIKSDTTNLKYFTGWRLSLEDILGAGLFKMGQIPFDSGEQRMSGLAVHIRGGDYRDAKGIGLLDPSYYRRSIESLGITNGMDITIFTDDMDYADAIVRKLSLDGQVQYSKTTSALEVLIEMSSSKSLIGSNSTLSWWAAFFSRSSNKVLPSPFYLQDWNADRNIRLDDVRYINRFPNKMNKTLNYVAWNYFRN